MRYCCSMVLCWNLVIIVSWLDLGYVFFWKKMRELKYDFYHIVYTIYTVYHCSHWPWQPGWDNSVCQVSPLYSYSFSSPFQYCNFGKKSVMYSPCLRSGELQWLSLKAACQQKCLGIFLHRNLFLFSSHLFNPLFLSIWTQGYSFYTLSYNSMLTFRLIKLFQLWTLGVL